MVLKQLTPNLYVPENFEENHVYFADAEGKKKYTGVTTILGVLAKPALIPWAARMACDYIKEKSPLREIQHEQGDQEPLIQAFYEVDVATLEEAKGAHARKRDEGAKKGTDTHALVEEWVKLCIEKNSGWVMDLVEPRFEPINPLITWASEQNVQFLASEAPLVSKSLFVAGTADLIFEKDGKRYIGDIKTFKKIYDRVPFYQCAGYALMNEEMNQPLWDSQNTDHKISGYCIINLPKEREFNESEDILWSFDTEGDTKAFLACVEIYRQNAQFKPNYSKKTKV